METAMTTHFDDAARTIARTRSSLALDFGRLAVLTIRKAIRRLRTVRSKLAERARRRQELAMLVHADARILADIGVTRFEVIAALDEGRRLLGRSEIIKTAAARQEQAFRAAQARRSALTHADAPPLVPALPHALETSNFR
jgi:uncharacterized protein YjiS (DUF1127 family)